MAADPARIAIPIREIRFQYARSSGAGGQNVNKVETKAVLRWPVVSSRAVPAAVRERFLVRYCRRITKEGELVITSQRFRDRGRNVADCLEKLHAMLDSVAIAPKSRRKTRPTGGSRERRMAGKRHRGELKQGRRPPGADD